MFLQLNHLHWHRAFWMSSCSPTGFLCVLAQATNWFLQPDHGQLVKSPNGELCSPALHCGLGSHEITALVMDCRVGFQQRQRKKAPLGKHKKLRIATMDLNPQAVGSQIFQASTAVLLFPSGTHYWHSPAQAGWQLHADQDWQAGVD